MKKYAFVENEGDIVLKIKDFDDDFSPLSLDHKFGTSYDVRIIPYEVDADLTFDPETEKQLSVKTVFATEVRIVKSIVNLTAEELADIADYLNRNLKMDSVAGKAPVLREWSDDAENITVTSGNAVTILQQVVTRLGKFFSHFADLIEGRRYDK